MSVSWIRSWARPMSRRSAESRRLAVSSTLPRLSRHPSMATASPENSPTSCRRPPRRGNWSPTASQPRVEVADGPQRLDRLGELFRPRARLPSGLGARDGECRAARRTGASSPRRVLRPSRSSAPGGRGSRRGRRWARSAWPRLFPASRPRERRPACGPCRSREARACACPCPLTTAISAPRPLAARTSPS